MGNVSIPTRANKPKNKPKSIIKPDKKYSEKMHWHEWDRLLTQHLEKNDGCFPEVCLTCRLFSEIDRSWHDIEEAEAWKTDEDGTAPIVARLRSEVNMWKHYIRHMEWRYGIINGIFSDNYVDWVSF